MKLDDFIAISELPEGAFVSLLELSGRIKRNPQHYGAALTGRTLAMLFQKASTRTRVSFEVGMVQLGGHALFLGSSDLQLARGEAVSDTARVLSRYCDGIMARTYAHADLLTLKSYATIPVINGLTDFLHPCQALADYYTILERFGTFDEVKVCYLGDGNNVAHSLMAGAAALGMEIAIATPTGYRPNQTLVDAVAQRLGERLVITDDLDEALADARVVYTDVWTSMGQEAEREARLKAFEGFRVTEELMERAAADAVFMHCLPAHRGEEVDAAVIDGPASIVFDQAENRLHTQKAVLLAALGSVA